MDVYIDVHVRVVTRVILMNQMARVLCHLCGNNNNYQYLSDAT
jgi:hypothetical protein